MNKPTEIVSWTGRRSPTTGKRKTTYTVGKQRFSNIEDARKAKRAANIDPFPKSPLQNMFTGPVPTMETIIPGLKKKNEGWKFSPKNVSTEVILPNISEGPVPTMETIIPGLKKKKEGWEFPDKNTTKKRKRTGGRKSNQKKTHKRKTLSKKK